MGQKEKVQKIEPIPGSRNAEAFMEQIAYWWQCISQDEDKIKYMNKMVASWIKLGNK